MNSSEIRVGARQTTNLEPFPRIGGLVTEVSPFRPGAPLKIEGTAVRGAGLRRWHGRRQPRLSGRRRLPVRPQISMGRRVGTEAGCCVEYS